MEIWIISSDDLFSMKREKAACREYAGHKWQWIETNCK